MARDVTPFFFRRDKMLASLRCVRAQLTGAILEADRDDDWNASVEVEQVSGLFDIVIDKHALPEPLPS